MSATFPGISPGSTSLGRGETAAGRGSGQALHQHHRGLFLFQYGYDPLWRHGLRPGQLAHNRALLLWHRPLAVALIQMEAALLWLLGCAGYAKPSATEASKMFSKRRLSLPDAKDHSRKVFIYLYLFEINENSIPGYNCSKTLCYSKDLRIRVFAVIYNFYFYKNIYARRYRYFPF